MAARVVSVNVGRPVPVAWRNESVSTAIFKTPTNGPVRVGFLNLDGDRQADLSVHGGPLKALYAYPEEHYAYWRELYRDRVLTAGAFGENLTVAGMPEDDTFVGDRLRIGTALFHVTQPRVPCYKLGIKFDDQSIVKTFLRSGRTGYYLKVVEEGVLAAGDLIARVGRGTVSIADVLRASYPHAVEAGAPVE
jgi:MOSC domain-containing protein YiiM